MKGCTVAAALAVFQSVTLGQGASEPQQRKISVEQGRELIYTLLQPTGCTETTCTVNRIEERYFPQYYFFYGSWANSVGSPHIGTWAVDPATADVWDANGCVEYKTAALTKRQALLRKGIGLTAEKYTNLKRRPPMCEAGEMVQIRAGKF